MYDYSQQYLQKYYGDKYFNLLNFIINPSLLWAILMNYRVLLKSYLRGRVTQQDIIDSISIYSNNLIDLGCVGNSFTWHTNRHNEYATFARLYRTLANHMYK